MTDPAARPRPTLRALPLVAAAAVFVLAGGYIHLREWLNVYRDIPSVIPGAAVVRVGFPINAGVSVLVAIALIVTAIVFRRLAPVVLAGAMAFEVGSLTVLILSRTSNVAGWMEPGWTPAANQTRAVELAALVMLLGAAMVMRSPRGAPTPASRPDRVAGVSISE